MIPPGLHVPRLRARRLERRLVAAVASLAILGLALLWLLTRAPEPTPADPAHAGVDATSRDVSVLQP